MSAQDSHPLRVLLVEDDRGDAEAALALLGAAHAEVTHVGSAEDALSRLDQRLPLDVVLLDLGLPGLSGVDAVRAVRARTLPEVSVVVLTANDDADLALLAIATGAQDVLLKRATDASALARAIAFARRRQGFLSRMDRERATAVQANLAKTEFVTNLSHDVRTPLNTVLGMAELLAETALTPEQARRVETLRRAGDHLLRLVDDMVDLSRIESGRTERASLKTPLQAMPKVPESSAGEFAGLRVLLVDDSDESRALIAAYLGPSSATLEVTDDARSALERLARETFDVVLMDLHLPGMDGFAATRALRQAEAERGARPVPVVALSADILPRTVHAALACGCSEHLGKPIRKADLLATLRRHAIPTANENLLPPTSSARSRTATALLPKFLGHRERDVKTLREALKRLDFDPIATIGHNMRGNGVSYGFPEVSDIGHRLEEAACAKNTRSTEEQIVRLQACLERIRVEARFASSPSARPSSSTRRGAVSPPPPGRKAAKA